MTLDGTAIALATFVISHIIITVWWASKVNTVLEIVQTDLKELVAEFKESRAEFVRNELFIEKYAAQAKEIEAIWRNIDQLKNKYKGG